LQGSQARASLDPSRHHIAEPQPPALGPVRPERGVLQPLAHPEAPRLPQPPPEHERV